MSNFHWLKVYFARYKHSQANLAHFHPSKTYQKHQSSFLSLASHHMASPALTNFVVFSGHSPARISIPKQPPSIGYHFPSSKPPNIISISTYFKLKVSDFNHVL